MAIPDYQTIMLPLLQHINDGKVHTARELKIPLADHFGVTTEELQHLLPSGRQTTFHNRVAWAKTYLERAGLLKNVRRGHFTITDRGREVINSSVSRIDNKFLQQFPEFQAFRKTAHSDDNTVVFSTVTVNAMDERTPEESLQTAHKQINDDLAAELLMQVKEMSPQFLENLVLDLMVSMGYGGAAASLTKDGSDEGIDGVINEDQLGLDIVYLQAKRWDNQVGRPEIQKFVGALHGKRAHKGVFLTTSTFSREARNYVLNIDPKVILIDGDHLTQLMIQFDVGVNITHTYSIKKLDIDYSSED